MFYYALYGSIIFSDIEFPQLLKCEEEDRNHIDIVIQEGTIPEDLKENEAKYCFNEEKSWFFNSTVWLMIEKGNKIIYELRPSGNPAYLRSYILGFAMSMLYLQRGEMAIHCAGVSKEGAAILIAGESGSGKSTVTDGLLAAGFQFVTDDMAIVKINESGEAIALPGFPYRKLCRDVVVDKGYCLEELLYINEEKDKFLVPYKDYFDIRERSLKAIFLLCKDHTIDKLTIEELKGIHKFYACVENLFLSKFLKGLKYQGIIGEKCLKIASKTRIYLIRRPEQINTVKEIIDYIVLATKEL